jgi:hypothetical protein
MAKEINSTDINSILLDCFNEYKHLSETEALISSLLSSIEALIESDWGKKEDMSTLFFLLNRLRKLEKELKSEKKDVFFKIAM